MAKQNIYDNEAFFENFQEIRKNEINYNDLIETPIFMSLLPDFLFLKCRKIRPS